MNNLMIVQGMLSYMIQLMEENERLVKENMILKDNFKCLKVINELKI